MSAVDALVVAEPLVETVDSLVDTAYSCASCDTHFASRNLLFRHLRDAHGLAPARGESDIERVALVFGYIGDDYHGLQRNDTEDTLPTVEGELWKAIGRVHPSFDEARRAKVNPPALSRAARTDRGVHAVSTVVGLSLPALGGTSARWLDEINAALPPDVRVLRRLRTTTEFHAQRHCERRRRPSPYELTRHPTPDTHAPAYYTRHTTHNTRHAARGTRHAARDSRRTTPTN